MTESPDCEWFITLADYQKNTSLIFQIHVKPVNITYEKRPKFQR